MQADQSTASGSIQYRRLRAPSEQGGVLIDPPPAVLGKLIAEARRKASSRSAAVAGRELRELAAMAKQELLAAARHYTAAYRPLDLPGDFEEPPAVVLGGHQPQLFHPGVWFKNVLLSRLAAEQGAIGVNLLIDSDAIKTSALAVPAGDVRAPRLELIPFDQQGPEIPYEERVILDRAVFESFGPRAVETLRSLVQNTVLVELWPLAAERSRDCDRLGLCLAQARHLWEARWGMATLELPQSRFSQFVSFGWFAVHLLAEAKRLRQIHNDALAEYRRVHKIRNQAHPAANLGVRDEWIETPFWIWQTVAPRRRRLWAAVRGRALVLSDGDRWEETLMFSPDGGAAQAVEQFLDLGRRGVKIRTRALATTLFARLFLGDLFVHGIGGAKYDQATDLIMRRFFDLEPPVFVTATATLRLPIVADQTEEISPARLKRELRELAFHPERFLDERAADPAAARLREEKNRWIATRPAPENARQRCQAIRAANEAFQPLLAKTKAEMERRLAEARLREQHDAVLRSREHPFCFFPAETLKLLFSAIG